MPIQKIALTTTLAALLCLAVPVSAQQHGTGAREQSGHQVHSFDNAESWAKQFDDPARDAWQKPAEVIAALKLAPGAFVADVGAGTGYFTTRLARALPSGKVYAVDAEPDMVRYLKERAAREKLPNITAVLAGESDARIPERVDTILIVDTYHHLPQRVDYFTQLRKSLKPKGRLVIIDFRDDSPVGPPRRFRIPPDHVIQELAKAGYRLTASPEFLPYQYLLIFETAGS